MTNTDPSGTVTEQQREPTVTISANDQSVVAQAELHTSTTPAQPPERDGRSITVKDLHAYYGDNHAIKGVSIDYAANRVTAMIGPSGCGKSTVLRCLNQWHEEIPGARAEGTVTLDDVDIYAKVLHVVSVRRAIGMVFQKPNPFPTMSIFDNVAAGRCLTMGAADNLRERVEQSLISAGLWDEVKDRLSSPGIGLSGGQQQRLCIARTIAVEPDVILMDEPCSALDPIATLRIEELVHEAKRRYTMYRHPQHAAGRARRRHHRLLPHRRDDRARPDRHRLLQPAGTSATEEYVTGKFG